MRKKNNNLNQTLNIALVVPHIYMQDQILGDVIFSPAQLALDLAKGLKAYGHEVVLYTPGSVTTPVENITADLSGFEAELAARGNSYIELLKKHPLTFISLARQVQAELVAKAYEAANLGKHDIVHVYINEEELALVFARMCRKPVVFTHHDPFNFLVKYRSLMPRYSHLNWLALSEAQKQGMPPKTNFIATVYHGLSRNLYTPNFHEKVGKGKEYIAYLGRIVEPKGVHLAIAAAKQAGKKLIIAGKHYAGHSKDSYWHDQIEPHIDGEQIEYIGFLKTIAEKQKFLGNADALIMPSTWNEPFGMVMIEALACGTPVIALKNGAIPEVIVNGHSGILVDRPEDLPGAIQAVNNIDRKNCRQYFEEHFTLEKMVSAHEQAYRSLLVSE